MSQAQRCRFLMSEVPLSGQVIAIVSVGFLFGALYPLLQNGIKYAQVRSSSSVITLKPRVERYTSL